MATISRTGITAGGTISPTHITNIIDALDGTGVGITVVATGSFSGSLVGTATTASYVLQAVSASFATTASYVANASSFPFTGSARITGSLSVTGSTSILGNVTISGSGIGINMYSDSLDGNLRGTTNLIVDLSLIAKSAGTGRFSVPTTLPSGTVPAGTMYFDDGTGVLYIYSVSLSSWQQFVP
jgi:hypothetical protein